VSGDPSQINKNNIDFSQTVILDFSLHRKIGKEISLAVNLLLPYTRWRNDQIFRDDPSTFYRPDFSLGTSLSIAYHFKERHL
jgi:hypothetical protein